MMYDYEATKTFDIIEQTTANGWYEIVIYYRNHRIEAFVAPTKIAALNAFIESGYRRKT